MYVLAETVQLASVGGELRKSNALYEFACHQCPTGNKAFYLGKIERNLYTRGREYAQNYIRGESESFLKKHQNASLNSKLN